MDLADTSGMALFGAAAHESIQLDYEGENDRRIQISKMLQKNKIPER